MVMLMPVSCALESMTEFPNLTFATCLRKRVSPYGLLVANSSGSVTRFCDNVR